MTTRLCLKKLNGAICTSILGVNLKKYSQWMMIPFGNEYSFRYPAAKDSYKGAMVKNLLDQLLFEKVCAQIFI